VDTAARPAPRDQIHTLRAFGFDVSYHLQLIGTKRAWRAGHFDRHTDMPASSRAVRFHVFLAACTAVALFGCNGFGPDAVQTSAVGSAAERNARLWAITAQFSRSMIPCGQVRAAVVDEDAGHALGDVKLQLITPTGETAGVSSSTGYVTLFPRDSGLASFRATRGKRVIAELDRWYHFRSSEGYILTLVLTPVTQAVVVISDSCWPKPDTSFVDHLLSQATARTITFSVADSVTGFGNDRQDGLVQAGQRSR
jgi:hypothetical protein